MAIPESEHHYPIDAENAAEMARLTRQARLFTSTSGILPASIEPVAGQDVLDIGCGPGEWANAFAQHYPDCDVLGIDISNLMVDYANAQAQERELRARFQVMDVRQPLALPTASFDIVHTRLITTFLTPITWPTLLAECFRLQRPGGFFCSTEIEDLGVTTSPALSDYNDLCIVAFRKAGICFTKTGDRIGITAMQERLLAQAGWQDIHSQAHVINYSQGMPAHTPMYENWATALKLVQPFFIQLGIMTQLDIERLYTRVLEEMQADDFQAVIYYQNVWGRKPLEEK